MKRIREWINHLSVRSKLIFYSYAVIGPIMIMISLVLLYNNYETEKTKRLETNIESTEALIASVNVLQTDIKDISTYIAVNDDVTKLLKSTHIESLNKDALAWRNNTPIDLVQDMISIKGHIKTIAIYPEGGVRPYLRGMDGSVYLSDINAVHESDIYQKTIESSNGMLWADVGTGTGTVYESSFSDKVVFCREIYNLSQQTKLGYIVIGVQGEYFDQLCANVISDEGEGVILIDPSGEVLSQAGAISEDVSDYLLGEEFLAEKHPIGSQVFRVGNYEVVVSRVSKDGTMAAKVLPRYSFSMLAADNVYTPLILLAAMLLGLFPILIVISNMVTKPLQRLSAAITELSKGDFTQQVEVSTNDEVGEVARCFNGMVTNIRTLIDENYVITLREKESELRALQSQINPHFLYNTLDSLYWQAMGADQEDIAESILALSDLFRLVLNSGNSEVTTKVELALVDKYLSIQKARFAKKMDYRIDIEKEAEDIMIPKLIVQPFAENAVVHGFEDMSGVCIITIQAKVVTVGDMAEYAGVTGTAQSEGGSYKLSVPEKKYLHIEVADTGQGMSKEQLEELWEVEDSKYRRQRVGKYAIRNIKERLELKYRGDFKLSIESEPGEGTRVVIEIPAEKVENKDM